MKNISFVKNVHIFPNFICAYQKKAVFSTNYPFTGDHRIFHAWMSDDIREYGLRAHLPFGTGQAGCPLKEGETPSNENDDLRRQLSDKLIRMNYFAD